jgi:AbiTii
MASNRRGLLAQIEADVVDDTVPLSSLLQKCIVLGGQAGSEKMRDWARAELNGYGGADTVPDYRHVRAAVVAVITNKAGYNPMTQRIDDSLFPRQVRDMIREKLDMEDAILGEGIGMLEGLASKGTDEHRLIPPWSSFIADTMNQLNASPTSHIAEVYWSVSGASIRNILVRIRTALAELVAELITLTPQDQDVPDKQAADQAVQFVITGNRTAVHIGDSRAGDIVTHSSDGQYNFGDITGNVAAGSSNVTQNYTAGFDTTKVREFADLITQIAGLLGLESGQQGELIAANSEFHEAIEDPKADKGRMQRAWQAVMGYLKLASDTALKNAAITVGNQVGNELDLAIHHIHP